MKLPSIEDLYNRSKPNIEDWKNFTRKRFGIPVDVTPWLKRWGTWPKGKRYWKFKDNKDNVTTIRDNFAVASKKAIQFLKQQHPDIHTVYVIYK